jgi:hypothetical protein
MNEILVDFQFNFMMNDESSNLFEMDEQAQIFFSSLIYQWIHIHNIIYLIGPFHSSNHPIFFEQMFSISI